MPKGEKVLVACCEEGIKVSSKNGIGQHVVLPFIDPNKPGKIVESGIDEIIGHFTRDVYFDTKFEKKEQRV